MQLSDLITKLPPYHFADAKKKIAERKAAGVDVISLSMGDPDLPAPQAVIDRLKPIEGFMVHKVVPRLSGVSSGGAIEDADDCI